TWGRLNYDIWVYADKWTMGPLRIALFAFWFATLFWLVRRYERQINSFTKGLLELLGRNSLFVYTVHAFIVFVLRMYFIPLKTNFWQNFLITTAGMAVLIFVTLLYKKFQVWLGSNDPYTRLKLVFKDVSSS
ncbi:MAG TPA: OpgC domain-containing protein, partial [Candidatus Saccharimonadales bacterium]|nr:OpgC domain-containing protein [Candidatus Saccharimonadales bacterium]